MGLGQVPRSGRCNGAVSWPGMASFPSTSPSETLARQLANSARELRAALQAAEPPRGSARWQQRLREQLDQRLAAAGGRPAIQEQPADADTAAQWMVYQALLDRCPPAPGPDPPAAARTPATAPPSPSVPLPRSTPHAIRHVVEQVERILDATDIAAAWEDLGRTHRPVQPEAHFYERFLARYARDDRRRHGVYYTPAPIVRYVVRSLDRLLRQTWRFPEGFGYRPSPADGRVPRLIDPACGSGTFLLGLMQQSAERSGQRVGMDDPAPMPAWPALLHGFDVQPVACLVARSLLEREWQRVCRVSGSSASPPAWNDARWSICWANALEQRRLAEPSDNGAARLPPLPIILGNPPYGNFGRRNRMPWIRGLLVDYKTGLGEKKLNLDDDFIKFLRWSQFHVDEAGAGIVALVTSNTFLSGLTHRRMRQSLRESFDQLYLLDLHGDRKRDVRIAAGVGDENVFNIQQGVAISVLVKTGRGEGAARVFHGELLGSRDEKLRQLDEGDAVGLCRRELPREVPDSRCSFTPPPAQLAGPYESFPRIDEIFQQYVSGVQTKRDALLVDRSRARLALRIRRLLAETEAPKSEAPETEAPETESLKTEASQRRSLGERRQSPASPDGTCAGRSKSGSAEATVYDPRCLRPYQVTPFDFRWLYYEPRLLGRARWAVARHMLGPNLALVFMRQSTNEGEYDHFLATTDLVSDRVFYSGHGAPFFAPLFVRDGARRTANLQPEFVERLRRLWKLPFAEHGHNELRVAFGARDVFDYLYAMFHVPEFRARYRQYLAVDFPRLPLTGDRRLVERLCAAGRRLVALHSSLPPEGFAPGLAWTDSGGYRVAAGYPKFSASEGAEGAESRGRLHINPGTWLSPVHAADWQFRLGGYRVLEKWLQARRGMRLRPSQRLYVTQLARVVANTRQEMERLEAALCPWPWEEDASTVRPW